MTFLPLFQQVVRGLSPTASGLQLLPLMGGLMLSSMVSGRLIARTGRYRMYPIVGTGITVVGLLLLSTHGPAHARADGRDLHGRARARASAWSCRC